MPFSNDANMASNDLSIYIFMRNSLAYQKTYQIEFRLKVNYCIFATNMEQLHIRLKILILKSVDLFYPPFRRLLPIQLFRYAVCGSANMVLGMLLYPVFYNLIFAKKVLYLGSIAISPHIASLITNFIITFPIGFYLSMFVVFPGSHLRRRIQLIRYFMVSFVNLLLNYFFMKVLVDALGWFPTPSYWITVALVVSFTYIVQRNFTFRKKKAELTPYKETNEDNNDTYQE